MIVELIIQFYIIKNNVAVFLLTSLDRLQNSREAAIQSRQVWFREEWGHGCQRILSQRLPQHVTQAKLREGQEMQTEEGGAADPREPSRIKAKKVEDSPRKRKAG